jgi:hypothetical protein
MPKHFPLLLLMLFLLSSCGSYETPMGIWKNEQYNIIMYIDESFQVKNFYHYFGLYTDDKGEENKILISFAGHSPTLQIQNISDLKENSIAGEKIYFRGSYKETKETNNELYCELYEYNIDSKKSKKLTFHRITEYEPIDPWNWFPWLSEESIEETSEATSEEASSSTNINVLTESSIETP